MGYHILMGFGESLPAPEAFFSLRRAGHTVSLFHRRGARRPLFGLALSCHPITAPEVSVDAATLELQAVLRAGSYDAFYAIDDVSLWLANRADAGRALAVHARGAQAQFALDKRLQIAAAQEVGLSPPPGTTDDHVPDELVPAIAKPALAANAVAGKIVKPSALYLMKGVELDAVRATRDGPVVVQSLIRGSGEGVFGFATENGIAAWSGHKRLRMFNPHGSGSSACTSHPPDNETRDKVAAMMTAVGWRGPFMVEFLRDHDGKLWFMEVNGRLWGSLALSRRLGMDHPAWAVAQAFDPAFSPDAAETCAGVEMRNLGLELLYPLFVLRGPKSDFHRTNWPHLWPAIRAAWAIGKAENYYNYDPQSPRLFLRDALSEVTKRVFR